MTAHRQATRRSFLRMLAASTVISPALARSYEGTPTPSALLLGASTPPGGVFLRHGIDAFGEHFADADRILVIVDASHPDDRDRQAKRIDAVLREANSGCTTVALHRLSQAHALETVKTCDGVFVGGGQTFLLLRSLYDRGLLEPLQERTLGGLPYAGSSAGANIAGPVIGTTNDFPVTDIPTRRSLGIFPALINPHHPLADDPEHASRAGKIQWYLSFNPAETVLGLSDPGIVRTHAGRINMVAGPAWLYRGEEISAFETDSDLTKALIG